MANHDEQHVGDFTTKLNWLRAAVLGANDGIISMAALLVGVAGASATVDTLVVTGVAGLLAGAFSMAAGEYVSVSSQRDTERALLAKEKYELENFQESEFAELRSLYEQKGLSPATAELVARELSDHDALAAHAEAELGIDPTKLVNPWHAGIASAISYSIGGIIPFAAILLPIGHPVLATFIAVVVALVITGVASARVSGAGVVRTTIRVVAGGLMAMLLTFLIGRLFNVAV